MKDKEVAILLAPSKFEVLRKAAYLCGDGIRQEGYKVDLFDSKELKGEELFEIVNSYEYVISLQAAFMNTVFEDGTAFVEHMKCKYIGWTFDCPWYHLDKVVNARFDHVYLKTIDQGHVESIRNALPNSKNIDVLFHGGFECTDGFEKTHDILFSGNMSEEPQVEEFIENPSEIELFIIENGRNIMLEKPEWSVDDTIFYIFEQIGESLTDEIYRNLIPVMMYLESWTRYTFRKMILEKLVESKLNITIIGEGYSDEIIGAENVNYLGGMDIQGVVNEIGHSKITVDTSSMYPYGFHERIFTAMLCKSVCFTPYSNFRKKKLGEHAKFINLQNLDEMINDIYIVLENWNDLNNILDNNYKFAIRSHTWKERGKSIIKNG